jgi:hypothetical protein
MENVSMSWWLSKPVQAYLDNEVTNVDLLTVLEALRTQPRRTPETTSALQANERH